MTKLEALLAAIVHEEGRPADDTNPFDLRDPVWFPGLPGNRKYFDGTTVSYKLLGSSGRFWNPRTRAEGWAGGLHVVALHAAEGDTLQDFLGGSRHYSGFAPASENNTASYVATVAARVGVDPKVPMLTWLYDQGS